MFTATEVADVGREVAATLDHTATVYGEDAATGAYSVVLRTGLLCALHRLGTQPDISAADRAELAASRRFVWDATYALPETAQVDVGGVRWQPVAGTFWAYPEPPSTPVLRSCDVVRVQVGAF